MSSSKRLITACAVLLCCNMTVLVLYINYNIGTKCFVTVDIQDHYAARVSKNFISFGIDASEIQYVDKIDFSNKNLRELAAALAPGYLRLGGTMSERLIFSKDDIGPITCDQCHGKHTKKQCGLIKKWCKNKFLPFFVMTGSKWMEINQFCKTSKLNLLFSFNVLLRSEHGWNDQNAKEILNFSRSHNYNVDWQLGNEPNSFTHTFNVTINPDKLSHDFKRLRNLLNEYGYGNSLLVGPDTTRPQSHRPECLKYMVEFLGNGSKYISARSWHQYYLNSVTAKLEDFWNPNTLDLLNEQIEVMSKNTQKYSEIPMWLSETSSSYGGGAAGLSNSYAGSPLWLDKLGLCALNNISTVIRQSLVGGNYSLLDKDYEPLPDWWISYLFKKLVGDKVLKLKCQCSRHQRMYIHCANKKYAKQPGSITLYGLNLEMKKVKFFLNGSAFSDENFNVDEFIVSAPSNKRQTKTVLFNGRPLYYTLPLPKLPPRVVRNGRYISMPPYSLGFWVIKNTGMKICN